MARRAAHCRPPCANGKSITSATWGMARYTGATQGKAPTVSRSPRAARRRISGSVIPASPIHWGAMTRDLMSTREMLAVFQVVDGAAIRALGFTGAAHIQVHLGVGVPGLHARHRAGAKHAALVVQVFGQEFNRSHGFPI